MTALAGTVEAGRSPQQAGGVRRAFRVERRKLSSQLAVRLLALVWVLAPFVFAALLKIQSGAPADDLYGVYVHSTGYALSLVLLGFAGAWGLPVAAGIVSGDMFSGEDRYGTWKLVLTRSCTRRELFIGKLLAAALYVVGLSALAAVASLVAGVVLIGAHPMVSLNGTQFSSGHVLLLVLAGWALCILPALGYASLGVLFSVATRNGIMGVIGPALCALAMQLLQLIGSGVWMHMLLLGSALNTWSALFNVHPFYGPMLIGLGVSVVWIIASLAVAWRLLRRRDFAGTPVSKRAGWVGPVRAAVALAAVIAFAAIASNWGPAGVTAHRLKTNFVANFNNLTVLQQAELGRKVPAHSKLNILFPSCSRRGSASRGPGEWICVFQVLIPTAGSSLPTEPTDVDYDVSVDADGCYKAQSPPVFIGSQTMRDAHGHDVVNPLYTIYGCINTL